MTIGPATRRFAYAHDLPAGSRVDPDDECWPCAYTALGPQEAREHLHAVAGARTAELHGGRVKADTVNFQPCVDARSQDRAVVREIDVHGRKWIFAGVFDGHLGEDTVEHTAHHMPIIVEELLCAAACTGAGQSVDVDEVAGILREGIRAFDEAIARDVLDLFPGGLAGLWRLPDAYVSRVVNDAGGENYRKVKLCMYGTTALLALVDPAREHLWTANLGDCQGVLVKSDGKGATATEVLTRVHNGSSGAEIARVVREHPGEPGCVSADGRVLGVMAPFRCIGDVPFKLPPIFTRKVLYNLHPGFHASSPWEHFLVRNRTPPYISADAEVVHQRLGHEKHFLVLCTDGFADLSNSEDSAHAAGDWSRILSRIASQSVAKTNTNLAAELLHQVLGGDNVDGVSRAITLELEEPWFDDATVIVLSM